jgi:hypothetical protein
MHRWKTDPHRLTLRSIPLFAGCSDAELQEIDRVSETVEFAAGTALRTVAPVA